MTPEFDALVSSFSKARARWALIVEKNPAEMRELGDEAEEVIRRLAPKPRLSQRDLDALATAYSMLSIVAGLDNKNG